VRVVSLQFKHLCRRIDRQYKQNMQKFDTNTDSDTDRMCAAGILPRIEKKLQHLPQSPTEIPMECVLSVFYQELKKNNSIFHNHRRPYRRNLSRRYFTESYKKLQPMPQSLTHFPTEALTTVQIPMRATFRLPGRSVHLSTEEANPMRACSDIYLPTDVPMNFKKSGGIFKILVRNSKNTNENYQQNLMPPPKKILFYVPLVIPSITLQYKTQPPLRGSFFLQSSSFIFSSPHANPLCFLLYFYCFDCSFQHIKRYDSPFFIFVFFLLFFLF